MVEVKQNQKQFNDLLKSKSLTHTIFKFTPKLAEHILVNLNHGNRNDKPTKIKLYKQSMIDNNWELNGESIKFGHDGLLKDGQNRLKACFQSKKDFVSCVHFGLEPKFFLNLDTGVSRNAKDVFKIMGVRYHDKVPNVLRLINAWEEGKSSTRTCNLQNKDLQAIYENDTDIKLLEESIKIANKLRNKYPISHLATLYYLTNQKGHHKIISKFFDELDIYSTLGALSPIRLALSNIQTMKIERIPLSSHHYSVILTRVWDCYLNKKRFVKDNMIIKSDSLITPII
tara:strand:+ start:2491 stop:3345 length:855 start_codon:yes stop_codon:yes gene_type:complete